MKNARLTYLIIVFGGILWCAGIILAPVFHSSSGPVQEAGKVLYVFFSPICHQMEARSFVVNGMPWGVCSRCSGIYFGFLAGMLLYPAVRRIGRPEIPSPWPLAVFCIPMMVDAFPWRFGIYEATLLTRSISGSLAGFALAFFIVPAAIQGVAEFAAYRPTVLDQSRGIQDVTETR